MTEKSPRERPEDELSDGAIRDAIRAVMESKCMRRYDLVQTTSGYTSDHEMQPSPDGEWVRFDDARPDGIVDLARRQAEDREIVALQLVQELLDALKGYVEWFGAAHVEGCPADDTCFCSGSAISDAVNAAIRKAEA